MFYLERFHKFKGQYIFTNLSDWDIYKFKGLGYFCKFEMSVCFAGKARYDIS